MNQNFFSNSCLIFPSAIFASTNFRPIAIGANTSMAMNTFAAASRAVSMPQIYHKEPV